MKAAFLFWENLKVLVGVRGLWQLFPFHQIQCLLQFEATEDDSAWQLIWACNQLKNPKQKAELFGQILEEAHHAELFRTQIAQSMLNPPARLSVERKPLYLNRADIWKYFPYCIVGETEASVRFDLIRKNLPKREEKLQRVFRKILSDEVGHIHKAKQLAADLNQPPEVIEKEIQLIQWNRFKEHWIRSGQKLIQPVILLILWFTYFTVVMPFALWAHIKEK